MVDGQIISGLVTSGSTEVVTTTVCSWTFPQNTLGRIEAYCVIQGITNPDISSYRITGLYYRGGSDIILVGGPSIRSKQGNLGVVVNLEINSSDIELVYQTILDGYTYRVSGYIYAYTVEQYWESWLPSNIPDLLIWLDPSTTYLTMGTPPAVTTITPRVGIDASVWTQATPAQQPNLITVGGMDALESDKIVNTQMQYTGAISHFNSIHDGLGGSWWFVFVPLAYGGCPFGNLTSTQAGIYPYLNTNGSIRVVVGRNGTGYAVDDTSATGLISLDTTYIIIQRWNYLDGNYEVYLGGSKIIDAGYLNAPSVGDANYTLGLFTAINSTSLDSSIQFLNMGIIDRKIDDIELAQLGGWLRDNVGGTWV